MAAKDGTFWFWSDWLGDPAVRRLTPAERGVWIDLLALAAAANPIGYVCDEKGKPLTHEEIARVTNAASPVEVAKLISAIIEKGAASRDRAGRIFNRRMVRMASVAAKRRLNGKLGGAATRLKWQAFSGLPQQNAWQMPRQPVRPPYLNKKESSTNSESEIRAREESGGREEQAGKKVTEALEESLKRKGPPEAERPAGKRASDYGRAELEQIYAAKHSKPK